MTLLPNLPHPLNTRLQDPPCLVMEYCARGSVYGVLSGAAADPAAAAALTWPRLLRFCLDAAKGMLYLHTLRPPIVHRCVCAAV